jgi:hypothetical protein
VGFADAFLKIWAWGALVMVATWVILYFVYQALGSNEISFILTLSAGAAVAIVVLVVGNSLKKRL